MASLLLHPLFDISSSPTLIFHRNSRHVPFHFPLKPSKQKSSPNRPLTISFALAESDSPKSLDQETLILLQDLSDSFDLPPDYFAQLPRDLRLDLNDAAFDLANGTVIDECGQDLGETLLNLSRAWELVSFFALGVAFGKRLLSSGRRFQSMGQYGQGELQRIAKAMITTGKLLSATPVTTRIDEQKDEKRMLKFGELQVELTSDKANIGAAIGFAFAILSWQLSQGVQNVPESSLQYANDNALLLAKSLRGALLALCYSSTFISAVSTVGLILLGRQLKSKEQ
ncbi:hypothetical protein HHK36_020423 [Tetracentron sinense]|uniref:LOW protein: ammonium transporter 1-like protein n=1 Tax=Tetracentron sinense TaxID=13715 RepID=A0A835D8T7_TETSI|nr:hypothetical protein HHK36_020423 [Tetracentron sinense]